MGGGGCTQRTSCSVHNGVVPKWQGLSYDFVWWQEWGHFGDKLSSGLSLCMKLLGNFGDKQRSTRTLIQATLELRAWDSI